MANWNLPSLTDLYANFMAYLKGRDDDAVRMNDSRVASASNLPEHAKRWNDSAKTLQNWASGAWSNLVLSIAGGGTGATTAAGARSALDVYSRAEVNALSSTDLASASDPSITTTAIAAIAPAAYTGPSVSLAPGTWKVDVVLNISCPSGVYGTYWGHIKGSNILADGQVTVPSGSSMRYAQITMVAVVTLGATTTVSGQIVIDEPAARNATMVASSHLVAVKIA